jgi:UDP-N-acetylglucosamine 2-epimerase
MKVTIVIGTRPEFIKMLPVIRKFKLLEIDLDIIDSGQHKELLKPYWDKYNITPTHTLDLMKPGQSLAELTAKALSQLQNYFDGQIISPSLVLAQGDTTTVLATAMVCFYNKIKFAHIEAGLRSFDFNNPFPEEFNRKVTSLITDFHFCPTEISKRNLNSEGIGSNIYVVGNTVVDSLNEFMSNELIWVDDLFPGAEFLQKYHGKLVLITCHRRENHGANLDKIITTISILAEQNPDFLFFWAVHPNPNVNIIVQNSVLKQRANVVLSPPLDYFVLLRILQASFCVITDSGGIQEEAPSFKVPVLILRSQTERPEGVNAGIAYLVDNDTDMIIKIFDDLKLHRPSLDFNPYGDGNSSQRIVDHIISFLNNLE